MGRILAGSSFQEAILVMMVIAAAQIPCRRQPQPRASTGGTGGKEVKRMLFLKQKKLLIS